MCLKHLDLCSGIGGFALGLQSTGYFKAIGFCEIDPFCQKVLKKNFPGVPIYNDIKEFKPNDEGIKADIVTSGFPCQPFSVAGKQKGKDDNRNLWKETFRIIKESRPTWFIGENVGGIVKLYLDTILEDLESEGYSTRCFSISASSIGAKHRRERIWIVSYSNSRMRGGRGTIGESGTDQEREFSTTQEKSECQTQNLWSKTIGCNALSGETENENWWQTFSKFHRIPDGISYELDKDRAKRIKGLGNAIVPQIPYYIGQVIGRLYE